MLAQRAPQRARIPDGPSLVLNNRKKGSHLVPLRTADARQIAARAGQAQAAALETIWFEEDTKGELPPSPTRPCNLAFGRRQSALV